MCISSLSYMPMHDMLKRKKYAKKNKNKKNQDAFKYGCKHVSRRCGSFRMYLKGDSPHQVVMIVCELNWFFISQIILTCRHLCNLVMPFTHNTQNSLLFLIHVQVQCDLATTRNTCVNVCSTILTCFWNIKLVRLVQCVCVCVLDLNA